MIVVAIIMDILDCTKKWLRSSEIVMWLILMAGVLLSYRKLADTAEDSANFAYNQHRRMIKAIFFTTEGCLLAKTSIAVATLTQADRIEFLQQTSLAQRFLVVIPVIVYCVLMKDH